jgi:hypothetical protein
MLVDESGQPAQMTPVNPEGGVGGGVSFDDMTPCFFSQTVPLEKFHFKHVGITFKGPNPLDGGAVLDECGSFGVTGQSSPDFLAFNCGSTLANGGQPVGPETMLFTPPVPNVSLWVGSGSDAGQVLQVVAKNAAGKTVQSIDVTLTSAMQNVFLSGTSNIKKVIIQVPQTSSACVFVVDNIAFGLF